MDRTPIDKLTSISKELKIKVYEPFSEFLLGSKEESHFEISLLDCYRLAGHACRSMTGAFLMTAAAVEKLFTEDGHCVRGDVQVEFGTDVSENATGPKSNVISYITGAWPQSGFQGLGGKFIRKNLMSYNIKAVPQRAVRFHRISTQKSVDVYYNPELALSNLNHSHSFPKSWRIEVTEILENRSKAIQVKTVDA